VRGARSRTSAGAVAGRAYTPPMATLQRIPAENAIDEGLRCSFCGREPSAGSDLIGGSDAFICDECVATCNEITADAGDDRSAVDDGDNTERDGKDPAAPTFFRLLTEGDVAAVLPRDAMADAMEGALRRLSTGGAVQPSSLLATSYLP
jgi:ATP-dependent Clp protease ATP-binding subunit ClpX